MQYNIPMPGETILELWEPEMEQVLNETDLPKPGIDLTSEEYAKVCCLLLDIPIGENIIESLHMFF